MPIDPITGQLYNIATQGAPIGLNALQQRPDQFKALDFVMGGGAFGNFMVGVGYRSRRSLLVNGAHQGKTMRTLNRTKYYEESLENSAGTPGLGSAGREFLRDQMSRVNPFTWGRASTMSMFRPDIGRFENAVVSAPARWTRADRLPFVHKMLYDSAGNPTHIWDPHVFSRLGAASTWDRKVLREGNRELSASEAATVEDYLKSANPDLLGRLAGSGKLGDLGLKLQDAGSLMRMGMSKSITGRVGGFVQGILQPGSAFTDAVYSKVPLEGDGWTTMGEKTTAGIGYASGNAFGELGNIYRNEGASAVTGMASKSADYLAANTNLSRAAAEKLAGKTAPELIARVGLKFGADAAAQFVPGLDVALDAYLAYQAATFTAKMIGKHVVDPAANAFHSFEGNIKKPMFGMGYHDTLAASTSRARGVQAIQNSRLNARSVLGNEASSVAQHFS